MRGSNGSASRRLQGICGFGILFAAAVVHPAGASGEAAPRLLELVDDRGEALGAPVKVCFVEGLQTDCVDRPAGAGPFDRRPFDVLRVEGPEHGPATVRPGDLLAAADGVALVTVPRKATLRVDRASGDPVSAALFLLDGLDPAHPAHRLDVSAEGEVKVPAGDWLLALEGRGLAPDLHLLSAPPGATRRVPHRPGAGWSLVLRVVAKEDKAPVADARVTVQAPEPAARHDGVQAEAEEPERHSASTGPAGLALVSGIEAPLVAAEIAHPDFVAATEPGLSSTPGNLELREVALGRGAVLDATIRVDGEPASGWSCRLLDRSRPAAGGSRDALRMRVGADGLCRAERLPEGVYWLRVASEEEDAESGLAEREVRLYDGEMATMTFDLSSIPVTGEVRHGEDRPAGYTVEIFRESDSGSTNLVEPVAEAVTDEVGAYETAVWDPGPYVFMLSDAEGEAAAQDRADVEAPSARVDFELAGGDLEGIVVDEDGSPVPQAALRIDWRGERGRSGSFLQVGEDGTFKVTLDKTTGTLTVTAEAKGLRPDSASFALAEGVELPPVVLTLRRGGFLQGRLLSGGGAPVAGALVMSFQPAPDGSLERKGLTRTERDGTFEVLPAEAPPTRLFAGGAGCPLMVVDFAATADPVEVVCPAGSGTILVNLHDGEGRPVAGEFVLLRKGGVSVPIPMLAGHLYRLGQPFESDGSGRLTLAGLAPGSYDVYLASRTSESLVAQGSAEGYVGSVTLGPGETATLEAVVATPP